MDIFPNNTMKADVPGQVELYHSVLYNLVQIRNCGSAVLVRLTRDNFSARAKTSFIRHMAAEGFIPDRYQWYSEGSDCATLPVKWVTDSSWVKFDHQLHRQATRTLNYLTRGRLLALGLFIAALITAM